MPSWDTSFLISFAFPIEGDGPDCAILAAATVDCLQELLDVACTRAARLHPFGVRSDLAGVGPRQAIPRTPATWSSIRRSPALTCSAPKPRKPPWTSWPPPGAGTPA